MYEKYYKILGLKNTATEKELKTAYRKLSKLYHPDINPKTINKFNEINTAYNILLKKDTTLFFKPEYEEKVMTVFEELLYTDDLKIFKTININIKNIYNNDNVVIQYDRRVKCGECKGLGKDHSSNKIVCDYCNGSGGIDTFGNYCEKCQSLGYTFDYDCSKCNGHGFIISKENIIIENISSKFFKNNRIEFLGYGNCNRISNNYGTLVVIIKLDDIFNDYYYIENNNLYQIVDVHYTDAINGNKIVFKTLNDKKISIKLNEKTKDGDIYNVNNLGFYDDDNNRKPLFVKINIIVDYDRL